DLEADLEDVRGALRWALEGGDVSAGAELAAAIGVQWRKSASLRKAQRGFSHSSRPFQRIGRISMRDSGSRFHFYTATRCASMKGWSRQRRPFASHGKSTTTRFFSTAS